MTLFIIRYEKYLDKDNFDTFNCVCTEAEIKRIKKDNSVYSVQIISEIPEGEF